jgi:FtsP/CotA-like multicopper oxidase with cupredoxin domain
VRLVPGSDRGRLLLAIGSTLAVVLALGWMWWSSLLPHTYDLADMGSADYGGGPVPPAMAGHGHGGAVADRVVAWSGPPDREVMLTVRDDGERITVNGATPGPTLRFHRGDLVEVTLVNDNLADGTTLHWHGLDVPNAVDGVAGLTQDAVMPGESFVYRFVADQTGTYWYHSHQLSHEQVRRGLLGAVVVEDAPERDVLAVLHQYDAVPTLDGAAGTTVVPAEPGDTVRVRVVNTDNALTALWVTGAPYQLVAVDGTDLHGPAPVADHAFVVTAGGRADVRITVPAGARGLTSAAPRRWCSGTTPRGVRLRRSRPGSSTCSPTGRRPTRASTRRTRIAPSTTASAAGWAYWTVCRAGGGRSTVTCSRTCRCSWSRRAMSW